MFNYCNKLINLLGIMLTNIFNKNIQILYNLEYIHKMNQKFKIMILS